MRSALLLSLLPLALAAPAGLAKKRDVPAPLLKARDESTVIKGKYIVKLKEPEEGEFKASTLDETLSLFSNEASNVWNNPGLRGFASELNEEDLEALRDHPDVDFIEPDAVVTINAYVTQSNAPWGLARISHRTGTSGYTYDNSAGAGTCSYIIDTGIYTAHSDFGGRAVWGNNFVDSSNSDGNGHGTHVAGTVGGTTYGVAKQTKLIAVKVLSASGSGSISGIISGLNWVITDSRTRGCTGITANMSLGGSYSASFNSASAALVNAGIFLAVAAGNDNANAANYSPASEPSVCTVGATTNTDARSSFSNYGTLVDVFAPGSNILSTYNSGGTATLSGTSMASPHIAGLGAYLLALEGSRTPAALCTRIQQLATSGRLTSVPSGTRNLLAFNGNPSG